MLNLCLKSVSMTQYHYTFYYLFETIDQDISETKYILSRKYYTLIEVK